MPVSGQNLHDPNLRLRLLLLAFGGLFAASALLYWRAEYTKSQEYVEFSSGASISSSSQRTLSGED